MNLHGIRQSARAWGRRQLYSLFSSLGTLVSHPMGTLMTVNVLGVAMVLPMGLFVGLQNLGGIDLRREEWAAITVFLAPAATEVEARALLQQVASRADADAILVSPEEGMREFQAASGIGPVLDLLEVNPLPWVLQIRPRPQPGEAIAEVIRNLGSWLENQDLVDSVTLDHRWLQRLEALLRLGSALVSVLGSMFALAVIVVVANTIRLDVASRSREIEVLSLVGASDDFIRQPFLYSGLWYGFLGSALASLMLQIAIAYLQHPLTDLVDAYGNVFKIEGMNVTVSLFVLAMGAVLGLLGAWVSVERYLRQLRRGKRLLSI